MLEVVCDNELTVVSICDEVMANRIKANLWDRVYLRISFLREDYIAALAGVEAYWVHSALILCLSICLSVCASQGW